LFRHLTHPYPRSEGLPVNEKGAHNALPRFPFGATTR